jgi:hypothetical protein
MTAQPPMVDVEEYEKQLLRAGRNHGPGLLFDWWAGGELTAEQLALLLPEIWEGAEWPAQHITRGGWIWMFRAAGYCSSPPGLPAPTEPLTLSCGCTRGRWRGMSWTTNLDKAQWFAGRFLDRDRAKPMDVVTMDVPPALVLARCEGRTGMDDTDPGAEIVVDCLSIPRGAIRRLETITP